MMVSVQVVCRNTAESVCAAGAVNTPFAHAALLRTTGLDDVGSTIVCCNYSVSHDASF